MIPLNYFLFLGAFLFSLGLFIVITKRHAILILTGIELILNAANINLVAFNRYGIAGLDGQVFTLLVIILAACEVTVALGLILVIYQNKAMINFDGLKDLKE